MSLIPTSVQSNLSFVDLPLRERSLSLEQLTSVMGRLYCQTYLIPCYSDYECCSQICRKDL